MLNPSRAHLIGENQIRATCNTIRQLNIIAQPHFVVIALFSEVVGYYHIAFAIKHKYISTTCASQQEHIVALAAGQSINHACHGLSAMSTTDQSISLISALN